jgi:hypothetical protein
VASSKKNRHLSYTIEDYFLSYKEAVVGNRLYDVPKHKFYSIIKDYFKFLSSELLDNSKEIRLPARMGTLSVVKKKPKRYDSNSLRVDFQSSRDNKKLILHLNEHSDGYNFSFFWCKKDIMITNKQYYQLIMTRANKRRLAELIKTNKNDYIER